MLQTTCINLRTISLAFVMAAMLMVGTMAPVQQAAAQEITMEQRISMLEQISQLMQLVVQLMAQVEAMQAGQTAVTPLAKPLTPDQKDQPIAKVSDDKFSSSEYVCPYTWTRTLRVGSVGADVKMLQMFLNQNRSTQVAMSGTGSKGKESNRFDAATGAAVSKFQVMYRSDILSPLGLVNPTGTFNPSTKAKANYLCTSGQDDNYVNSDLQSVIDTLNNIGNKNDDDEADEAIEDLEDDLEEYQEWYADIAAEVADAGKKNTVEALLARVSALVDAAEDEYDDKDYQEVFELVDRGEQMLDQLNDVLDDIEDGRFSTNQPNNELQDQIDELLAQIPEILSFEAILDGRSDKYSPYMFFQWSTIGVSNCSIFVNGRVTMTNLPPNAPKLLSRHDSNEKYNVDFQKNNRIELRCQAANTRKDSTISEFENVYMGADYNESYKSEYKGYIDERLFITTRNITKKEAYENCEKNADNNPDSELRCTWGGELVYTTNDGKG